MTGVSREPTTSSESDSRPPAQIARSRSTAEEDRYDTRLAMTQGDTTKNPCTIRGRTNRKRK
jgi:hypothetical protein